MLSDSEAAWKTVFSTYVEVIPDAGRHVFLAVGILHVCGGDPMQDIPNNLKTGILHACGGDPLRD